MFIANTQSHIYSAPKHSVTSTLLLKLVKIDELNTPKKLRIETDAETD